MDRKCGVEIDCGKTFWIEAPICLITNFAIIPSADMTLEERMNAITRIVLIVFIIMLFLRCKQALLFLVISLAVITFLYYAKRRRLDAKRQEKSHRRGSRDSPRKIKHSDDSEFDDSQFDRFEARGGNQQQPIATQQPVATQQAVADQQYNNTQQYNNGERYQVQAGEQDNEELEPEIDDEDEINDAHQTNSILDDINDDEAIDEYYTHNNRNQNNNRNGSNDKNGGRRRIKVREEAPVKRNPRVPYPPTVPSDLEVKANRKYGKLLDERVDPSVMDPRVRQTINHFYDTNPYGDVSRNGIRREHIPQPDMNFQKEDVQYNKIHHQNNMGTVIQTNINEVQPPVNHNESIRHTEPINQHESIKQRKTRYAPKGEAPLPNKIDMRISNNNTKSALYGNSSEKVNVQRLSQQVKSQKPITSDEVRQASLIRSYKGQTKTNSANPQAAKYHGYKTEQFQGEDQITIGGRQYIALASVNNQPRNSIQSRNSVQPRNNVQSRNSVQAEIDDEDIIGDDADDDINEAEDENDEAVNAFRQLEELEEMQQVIRNRISAVRGITTDYVQPSIEVHTRSNTVNTNADNSNQNSTSGQTTVAERKRVEAKKRFLPANYDSGPTPRSDTQFQPKTELRGDGTLLSTSEGSKVVRPSAGKALRRVPRYSDQNRSNMKYSADDMMFGRYSKQEKETNARMRIDRQSQINSIF